VLTSGARLGRVFAGARVFAATGHMHQLGTNVRLDVVRADGTSECLVDIGPWDFNWQRQYAFAMPLDIGADDALRITCRYDNSAGNQPLVDGTPIEPRDVRWGEGSLDEMCMVYLAFTGGGVNTVTVP
jgi:hypothetical protein